MTVSEPQIAKYNNGSSVSTNNNYPTDNIIKNTEYINTKTRELYQMPGSMVDSQKALYNQTMVAGVMWTMLATSLVYYIFTEL
jgi:hypothetical protein